MDLVEEREDLTFGSGGESCAAWFYRPEGDGPHPCVVLAHGFGGTREARLWAYAERFRAAGIAALVFDYRHFGDSAGEPRQLISIGRQLDDWREAISFARSLDGVDPERVALWGSSFSGGHVVKLASEDSRIAAAISQTPFSTGVSALAAASPKETMRLTVGGVLDGLAAITGSEPHRIPIVAKPGRGGAMTQPGSLEGYMSLYDDSDAELRNEFCARAALALAGYAPARQASKVACPLLVCVVSDDAVTPPDGARRMAEEAPHGELIDYGPQGGHFKIYVGELFERTIVDQVAFLARAMSVPEPAVAV